MSFFQKLFRKKTPTTAPVAGGAPSSLDVAKVLVDAHATARAMSSIIDALGHHQPERGKSPNYVPLEVLRIEAGLSHVEMAAGLFCLEKRYPGTLWPSIEKPSAVVIGPYVPDDEDPRFAQSWGAA